MRNPPPFDVYIPAGEPCFGVAPGSALVSRPAAAGATNLLCYYAGNVYDSPCMACFEAKAFHAAGRLATQYPTAAMGMFPQAALIKVGQMVSANTSFETFPKDLHLVLSVPDHVVSQTLAEVARRAKQLCPDLEVVAGNTASQRMQHFVRRMPRVTIPKWCAFSATRACATNPTGYIGSGEYRELALAEVVAVLSTSASRAS